MLVAVPLRDQLDEKTTDGAPDENARANCVPASLAAALSALTGRDYEGDELKDAVYGQGYTGATDPARYVAYAAAQGVRMWEVDGSGAWMVAAIAVELARGHPVYGAIPSQWGNTTAADIAAHGGPTHAVMFCDASPGGATLTAMNPWPVDGRSAFYQTMPSAWWATRLVYGHIYPMERTMLQITDVAAFFTAQDDTHWTCRQNGHTLALGMLAAWRAWPAAGGLGGLTALGLPLGNEEYPLAGASLQRFERGVLVWDPDRKLDSPPGASGPVYLAHLESGPGQDPRVAALQAQLDEARHSATSAGAALQAVHALGAALAADARAS
ncbi:MAG TPA: hypothetical protein VID73_09190 [Ktedonobacterales bacterium]|jgi:hypothetical protein